MLIILLYSQTGSKQKNGEIGYSWLEIHCESNILEYIQGFYTILNASTCDMI